MHDLLTAFRSHTTRRLFASVTVSVTAGVLLCSVASLPGMAADTVSPYATSTTSQPADSAGHQDGSSSALIQGSSQSLTVPSGTEMTLAFKSSLDARITNPGEPFLAVIQRDITDTPHRNLQGEELPGAVLLPKGTLVRGRVTNVKRPGWFSQGGALELTFEHMVLPSGDLLPIHLVVGADQSGTTVQTNRRGELYSDPGVGHKLGQGVESGKETFSSILDKGLATQGPIKILAVPGAALGGAAVGTAVTAGKAVQALVGKGETTAIQPGDTIILTYAQKSQL